MGFCFMYYSRSIVLVLDHNCRSIDSLSSVDLDMGKTTYAARRLAVCSQQLLHGAYYDRLLSSCCGIEEDKRAG